MEKLFDTIKRFFEAIYDVLSKLLAWKDIEVSDVSSALEELSKEEKE